MEIRIWLGDLGAYNEGTLRGEWLTLPIDDEALRQCVSRLSRNGEGDYFIADWECEIEGLVNEHSSPYQLNEWADKLSSLGADEIARVRHLIQDQGVSFDDALDGLDGITYYEGMTLVAVAENMIDDGLFGVVPESLRPYIDAERLARDLSFDGYHETAEGVFHCDR